MPTTTTGRFFLAKSNAVRTDNQGPEGAFRLVLRLFDRQGQHRVEPYEVTWTGPAAAAWWQENREIAPGAVLDLTLINPRSMPAGRGAPETHATVIHCARSRAESAERADQAAA